MDISMDSSSQIFDPTRQHWFEGGCKEYADTRKRVEAFQESDGVEDEIATRTAPRAVEFKACATTAQLRRDSERQI